MRFHAVILRPRGPIHLGDREGDLTASGPLPHSDTLFSSFCNGYRLLWGKAALEDLLAGFSGKSAPFRVSSAFPMVENEHFFPRPLHVSSPQKDWKKVAWLGKSAFEAVLAGATYPEILERPKSLFFPISKEIRERLGRSDQEVVETPWRKQETTRVALSRLTNHPGERLFQCEEFFFSREVSLFFLAEVGDEAFVPRFQSVWRLLADEGLGGDRSVGKGLFHPPEFGNLDLNVPADAEAWVALSLVYPAEGEAGRCHHAFYELIERKGYIFSPTGRSLRRRAVRFLKEGSVFLGAARPLGTLCDVQPEAFTDHPVFRCGLALCVPCRTEGERHGL